MCLHRNNLELRDSGRDRKIECDGESKEDMNGSLANWKFSIGSTVDLPHVCVNKLTEKKVK